MIFGINQGEFLIDEPFPTRQMKISANGRGKGTLKMELPKMPVEGVLPNEKARVSYISLGCRWQNHGEI